MFCLSERWEFRIVRAMTAREFFDLVALMRARQREYFETRSARVLVEAKALERHVDNEIRRVGEIMRLREISSNDNETKGK